MPLRCTRPTVAFLAQAAPPKPHCGPYSALGAASPLFPAWQYLPPAEVTLHAANQFLRKALLLSRSGIIGLHHY